MEAKELASIHTHKVLSHSPAKMETGAGNPEAREQNNETSKKTKKKKRKQKKQKKKKKKQKKWKVLMFLQVLTYSNCWDHASNSQIRWLRSATLGEHM